MSYIYDNNVRKIPGPSYVFDYILKKDVLPSNLDLNKANTLNGLTADEKKKLAAVEIGRYILFDPPATGNYAGYEGTAWQKVVDSTNGAVKVTFALVADKYTNPIEGMTADEMLLIWKHVWGEDWN